VSGERRPFVVAGGIVRNRAWILRRHLLHVSTQGVIEGEEWCRPAQMFYLTGDNEDDTEDILSFRHSGLWDVPVSYARHDTGWDGFERVGRDGRPPYSTENMAKLRNEWLRGCLARWPELTHVWVVDSDVLPDSDVLAALLRLDKPVVAARVPIADGVTPIYMEGLELVATHFGKGAEVWAPRRTGNEKLRFLPFEATCIGGCYLIRRDAIDAGVRWYVNGIMRAEDGGFADSCRELRIEMWAEPLAACQHVMERP